MVHWNEPVVLIAFGMGVLATGVALYFILRALFLTRRGLFITGSEKDLSMKKERVEFVIDTFSALINNLKEKEEALERLRSQAESRASVAESYNEDILRCVGSGVITFNMDKIITTFNQAAERILKKRREQVLGLSCAEAFGFNNTLCHILNDPLLSGRMISRQEVELRGEGIPNIWVGLSISPLKDKEGRQIGIIMVFTDLTEIKMLREQSDLKKRLAMLGEMSAGIAHELRNSMGTIMGYVKILSKSVLGDESSREVISTIVSEINSMDLIIKELLNYGKPLTPSIALVDLNSLIRKSLDTTLKKFTDIKVGVDLVIPELPPVGLDEVLMRQAFQNLIQNAVEAMPDGGNLKIAVRSQKPSPHLPSLLRGGKGDVAERRDRPSGPSDKGIEILISDTGPGIPQEGLEKIFLPFYTTKPRGTGMGLPLVHKIILAHGGGIGVESSEGKGTTFKIYLPWHDK